MPDFRDTLYEQYFKTQAGRRISDTEGSDLKSHWTQLDHEVLPLLPVNKSVSILDIGCGYGSLIMLLKNKGYTDVRGIDISPGQVEKAHELGVTEVSLANVFDYLADKPAQFDVITGIDIIEHFSKDELLNLLNAIKSSLKPGGVAIFRTPNMDAPIASAYAYGDYTHQCLLNYSSARQIMLASGFNGVEILPSYMGVSGALKNAVRSFLWGIVQFQHKLILFASGRSGREVLFTPNIVIKVRK
jgi:2-polyprenyl-3-methyl-5-hydroxy-6-metoxy-1,4-benzoquinol methylase